MLYSPDRKQQLEKWKQRREEIRTLYREGMSVSELVERYKVSRSRIYQILGGIRNGKKQENRNGPAPPA